MTLGGPMEYLLKSPAPARDSYLRRSQDVFLAERRRRVRAEWGSVILAVVAFLALGIAWASLGMRHVEGVWIPYDQATGEPLALERLENSRAEAPVRVVEHMLRDYVLSVRSVTEDPAVRAEWLDRAYAYASGPERERIATESAAATNAAKNGDRPRTAIAVDVVSVKPLDERATRWEVVWKERIRQAHTYRLIREERWRAVVVIEEFSARTRTQLEANPYGRRVRDFLPQPIR